MIRGPHCGASPGAQKSPVIEVALGNGSCGGRLLLHAAPCHVKNRGRMTGNYDVRRLGIRDTQTARSGHEGDHVMASPMLCNSLCWMELRRKSGGEGGIQTLDTGVSPYNGLAKHRAFILRCIFKHLARCECFSVVLNALHNHLS